MLYLEWCHISCILKDNRTEIYRTVCEKRFPERLDMYQTDSIKAMGREKSIPAGR